MDAAAALCPEHPLTPALGSCSRCGRFLCDACAVARDPLRCAACEAITAQSNTLGVPPFTFGSTIAFGLSFFGRNLAVIAALALVFAVPEGLLIGKAKLSAVWRIVFGIPDLAFSAACMLAIHRRALDAPNAGLGAVLRDGLRAWPQVFFARLIAGLYVFGYSLMLIVPGILKSLSYAVVVPNVLFEAAGSDPLDRSAEQTLGHRGPIFGVLMLLGLVEIVAGFVFALSTRLALRATGLALPVASACVIRLGTLLVVGLSAAFTLAIYFGLKANQRALDQA